jgi:hypothetical protein
MTMSKKHKRSESKNIGFSDEKERKRIKLPRKEYEAELVRLQG